MSTTSNLIKMVLQAINENTDTWGTVLNVSALELLEDAIAGTATTDVTSLDQTLADTLGGPSDADAARYAIIDIIGSPGTAKNVIVPEGTSPLRSKIYLAVNNTTGGQVITVKTASGAGVEIPAAKAVWCYADGTDVLETTVANAVNSDTTTLADDSTLLGGIVAAEYAQLNVAQNWGRGQVTDRETITSTGGSLAIDTTLSNAFYHITTENTTNLAAPTGMTNGQTFSLIVQQGFTAGSADEITFQSSTFMFLSAVAPQLSIGLDDVDYYAFEYVTGLAGGIGARWIGSVIKGVGEV